MDRVRKISESILTEHRAKFGLDFKENKVALESISIVRSKVLKNKITGFITRVIKREKILHEVTEKREQEAKKLDQEAKKMNSENTGNAQETLASSESTDNQAQS